jgi:hypothetical protein
VSVWEELKIVSLFIEKTSNNYTKKAAGNQGRVIKSKDIAGNTVKANG